MFCRLEISATQTQIPVRKSLTNVKLTLTAMLDSPESVDLMKTVKLLIVNTVNPMVFTMSANQVLPSNLASLSKD